MLADGTLYYRKTGQKVVVSISERNSILAAAHIASVSSEDDDGESVERMFHANRVTMQAMIEKKYKWLDVRLDVNAWVCELYRYY